MKTYTLCNYQIWRGNTGREDACILGQPRTKIAEFHRAPIFGFCIHAYTL